MRFGWRHHLILATGLCACGDAGSAPSDGPPTDIAGLTGTLCESLVRPVPALEPSVCTAPQEVERHCQVRVVTAPENPVHGLRPDGADYALDATGRVTLEGGETYTRDFAAAHASVTDYLDDESGGCVALRSLVYEPHPGLRWRHDSSPAEPERCGLEVREGDLLTHYADEDCKCAKDTITDTRRFDADERLLEKVQYREGSPVERETHRYDARGNELEVASDFDADGVAEHTETFTYDAQDRMLSKCETWSEDPETGAPNPPASCLAVVYDDEAHTVTTSSQGAERVETYDDAGRLLHLQRTGGEEIMIERDARGLRLSTHYLNDGETYQSVIWTRDAAGRPTHIAYASTGGSAGSEDFSYDASGRVESFASEFSGEEGSPRCARTFTYEGEDCPAPQPEDEELELDLPSPLGFLNTSCTSGDE